MQIIEIAALENGAHRNQTGAATVPNGWAVIPEDMEAPCFPFGTIETAEIGGVVTVTKWTAGTLPPVPTVPNREKRKQAYSTGEVDGIDCHVTWSGETYTVDTLTLLGTQYSFREETATASEIQIIVEAGVAAIRAEFPDEEGGVSDG